MNGSPTPVVIGTRSGVVFGSAAGCAGELGDALLHRDAIRGSEVRLPREDPHRCGRRRQSLLDVALGGSHAGDAAVALGLLRRRRAVLERLVEEVKQLVVLPEAEDERDPERDRADHEPRAQLVEVIDDRQPIVVTDRLEGGRHRRSGC